MTAVVNLAVTDGKPDGEAEAGGLTLAEFIPGFCRIPLACQPGERWIDSAANPVLVDWWKWFRAGRWTGFLPSGFSALRYGCPGFL